MSSAPHSAVDGVVSKTDFEKLRQRSGTGLRSFELCDISLKFYRRRPTLGFFAFVRRRHALLPPRKPMRGKAAETLTATCATNPFGHFTAPYRRKVSKRSQSRVL